MILKKNTEHPDVSFGKTGILLINLGTPDSTKVSDVKKYLKNFCQTKE